MQNSNEKCKKIEKKIKKIWFKSKKSDFFSIFLLKIMIFSNPDMFYLIYSSCVWYISEANAFFDRLAADHGVDCPPPRTTARLLDKVSVWPSYISSVEW